MRYTLLPALALLAGCLSITGGDTRMLKFAVFTVNTSNAGTGQVITSPSAFFFEADDRTQLPSSRAEQNACGVQLIGPGGSFNFAFADPGDSVVFAASSVEGYMQRQGATPQYLAADPITFAAGADITFTIPGAPGGFPATTVTGKTAEPVAVDPIVLQEDQSAGGVPVTWSPAGNADSKIVLTLKYASPGSGSLDEQVLCVLSDDGSDVIPSSVAARWLASQQRESAGQRVRTTTDMHDDLVLHITSVYDATIQTVAPPAAIAAR